MLTNNLAELEKDFEKALKRHVQVVVDGLKDRAIDYQRLKDCGAEPGDEAILDIIRAILEAQERAFGTFKVDTNAFGEYCTLRDRVFVDHPEIIDLGAVPDN